MTLLEVNNLRMFYTTSKGDLRAVDDVTINVEKGHALGLAGESGCGKTSVALAILRLLPSNGRIVDGEILLGKRNLLAMKDEQFRKEIRWKKISMIFQGSMNALHPFKRIGNQIAEPLLIHRLLDKKEALKKAEELLDLVGIGSERIDRYPHELSGGMKQRTVIAMALACNPDLVIADEPTTALDVIMQAQVLSVITELQMKLNISMLLISHDLSLIAEVCNEVAIMYAGKIAEYGDATSIFKEPKHPYTRKLMAAFPNIDGEKREIASIPGFLPDLMNPPDGCRFHPRCLYARDSCRKEDPPLVKVKKEHHVACHFVGQ